jgi:hypothetical protein
VFCGIILKPNENSAKVYIFDMGNKMNPARRFLFIEKFALAQTKLLKTSMRISAILEQGHMREIVYRVYSQDNVSLGK